MKKITIKKTLCLSLITSISLSAYAADNNNQKKVAGTPEKQNVAATLMQAGARGALVRREQNKSTQQAGSTLHTELERLSIQQTEPNTAATLIQARIRGALARHEDLAISAQKNNAFFGTVQLTSATPTASQSSSYSSRSSESSESSEDSDMAPEENIEVRDQNGDTPLIAAAKAGQSEQVRALIARGADINATDQNNGNVTPNGAPPFIYGNTPLIWAAMKGHIEIVKILIAAGTNINIANYSGDTALLRAACNDHVEIVRTLCSHRANVDIVNQNGYIALIVATFNGHAEIIQILIDHGANVDNANLQGHTPLTLAAYEGFIEVVRTLCNHRANVNIANQYGNTPLILAAYKGHIEVVRILIDRGTNIDTADQNGNTALICAANKGHIEVVRTLIRRGANIDVSTLMLPNFIEIIQSTIELFRSQLAEQHPEDLMEFLLSDLEQFGQNSENATLESMSNAFIQVGEIITRDMSIEDRNNFRAGCRLFRKAASNGKNILARSKKIELFIKFITQLRQQLISLKEKNTGEEQIINAVEKVVALLDQELQQGHCAHRQETQNTDQVAQAAPATMCCITTQQAGPDAAFENTQVACATLNAERALRAQQETEYEQSLATDQRKAALENQIATLTQQADQLAAEHDIHAASLEIRQQAHDLYTNIIAARRELIGLIQTIQTCDEIFAQAKVKRLEKQSDALTNEQEQLAMIERAIDSYNPTPEEMRAARENFFLKKFDDGGKGKKAA